MHDNHYTLHYIIFGLIIYVNIALDFCAICCVWMLFDAVAR